MNWEIYFGIVIGVFSLLIGSFLNVCIYRIPLKQSIVTTGSHCFSCNTKIKPYDLIPVFSYIILGGKCRHCKEKISPRYMIVELLNFCLYMLTYLQFGLSIQTLYICLLSSVMIIVSMIDLDTMEIPDRFHIIIAGISVISFFDTTTLWWERIAGFVAASLILFVLALLTGGFGGGDIKLMAVCGICLGYKNILLALLIGIIIGGIVGVIKLITDKDRKASIPFGPSLCIGIFVAALYGDLMIDWYMRTFITLA